MKKTFLVFILLLHFLNGYTQQQVWTEIGIGLNGLNTYGEINSMVTDQDGNLYVAGGLLGTDNYEFVAKWDGETWSKLGNTNIPGVITKMVIDHSGNIYVTGYSTNSDNSCFVSKWDGHVWQEVRSATSSLHSMYPIYAMAIDNNDNLYTVSTEEFPDGAYYYSYNISKWDGTQWTELGVGANRLNANSRIHSMGVDNFGNVYAVGEFSNASGLIYVAKWNGTAWSAVDPGIIAPTGMNAAMDIAFDALNNLFVAIIDYGIGSNTSVMKWDGINWIQIPMYSNPSLINIPTSLAQGPDGNMYIGGEVYNPNNNAILSKYDGTTSNTLLFLPCQYPVADSRSYAWINSIVFDNSGKLYVAGTMFKDYENRSYTSILTLTTISPVVNSPVTYCVNQSALPLTAQGTNLKWYTTATKGIALNNTPVPNTQFADTIYYYVSQTIDGNESKRVQVQVIVIDLPQAPLVSSPIAYCQNNTSTALQATGTQLKWYTTINKDFAYNSAPIPSSSNVDTLSYFVSQTHNGCEGALAELNVIIKESPAAHITSPNTNNNITQVCNGQFAILTANAANSYMWSTGESTKSISISTANIYSVEVTYSNDCKARDTIDVGLVNPPLLSLGNDTILCNGETKTIHLNIPNALFMWSDGSTNADYTISQNGKYWVAATVLSCPTVKDTIQINYISKIDYNIPNLITYNHDGLNDKFTIPNLISNTHVELYNGWGALILKSENYTNDWSPENEGNGVYYYSISNPNNCVNDYKGWLEVIK